MKIGICTTPIRPNPTDFPPFGSMAILQSLRKIGEKVQFYNIDYLRPEHQQIIAYFRENQFDLVGISAVVSTAYAYTKYLADLIRSISPHTTIVVGGNLAASAEILLRKCEVDFCIVGDGEIVIQDLVQALYKTPWDYEHLKSIKGICFLEETKGFCFTGYATPLAADKVEFPDYDLLEADGSLSHFISENLEMFYDSVSPEERQNKKVATVITTKGCVARCTFCHRWEKGYRAHPEEQSAFHIQYLKNHYNVGFISIGDENFGSDQSLTRRLVNHLGKMDIYWRAAGVRTRSVNLEMLKHWKANGCVAIFYGIESGSQTMLNVMEKNVTVERNIEALKWTYEAGLLTIIQLVLGMPGETDHTIRETIVFLKKVANHLFLNGTLPGNMISINYAQALPGTPLYEHARQHGFIGKNLDDEEAYLIAISNTDAYNTDHFINYTGQPLLKVLLWRHWMKAEVDAHYLNNILGITLSLQEVVECFLNGFIRRLSKNQWMTILPLKKLSKRLLAKDPILKWLKKDTRNTYAKSGYFNIMKSVSFAPLFLNPITKRYFYPLLALAVAIRSADTFYMFFSLVFRHLFWSLRSCLFPLPKSQSKSLRKRVNLQSSKTDLLKDDMMIPLRLGR